MRIRNCLAKGTINKVNSHAIDLKKMYLAKHVSDKGLGCKVYKELIRLNNKTDGSIKMSKELNRHT